MRLIDAFHAGLVQSQGDFALIIAGIGHGFGRNGASSSGITRIRSRGVYRQLRPQVAPDLIRLAAALREHGDKTDPMESLRDK